MIESPFQETALTIWDMARYGAAGVTGCKFHHPAMTP
jgi:hypothetical protein